MNYKIPIEIRKRITDEFSNHKSVSTILSYFQITRDQYLYAIKHNTLLGIKIKEYYVPINISLLAKKYNVGRGTIYAILNGKHPKKKRVIKEKIIKKHKCPNCNSDILLKGRKYCSRFCASYAISTRMQQNNPMKQKDTVLKMSKTLKDNYEKGIIKKKFGKAHWLYKGNRKLNLEIRTRLYPVWTKKILIRDNFTCTKCGSKVKLQVHHIRPLRDIINQFDSNTEKEELIQLVLNEHKLSDGITVCKKCHKEIDERYRIKCI